MILTPLSPRSSLFGLESGQDDLPDEALPSCQEWDEAYRLRLEKESLGFYITGHPLARFSKDIKKFTNATTDRLMELDDAQEVRMCGTIAAVRTVTTKRGDPMATLRMEDLHGTMEVIIFPDLYKKVSGLFSLDAPVLITGTLDRGDKGVKIKVTSLELLQDYRERSTKRIDIRLLPDLINTADLKDLKSILSRYPGSCPVFLHIPISDEWESVLTVDDEFKIQPSDEFLSEFERSFTLATISLL